MRSNFCVLCKGPVMRKTALSVYKCRAQTRHIIQQRRGLSHFNNRVVHNWRCATLTVAGLTFSPMNWVPGCWSGACSSRRGTVGSQFLVPPAASPSCLTLRLSEMCNNWTKNIKKKKSPKCDWKGTKKEIKSEDAAAKANGEAQPVHTWRTNSLSAALCFRMALMTSFSCFSDTQPGGGVGMLSGMPGRISKMTNN